MKKYLLIFALCTLMGCKSIPQTETTTHHERDSTYKEIVRYDSIYIYRDRYVDRSKDMLYVRETNVEYRYRLLRDTICITQRDSIPYPVTVVETREVRHTPWYIKTLACIGAIEIIFLIVKRF